MMPPRKVMDLGMFISGFGVLLLLLKLVGIPVGIGYFFILCIIAWPLTLLVSGLCMLGIALAVFSVFVLFEER